MRKQTKLVAVLSAAALLAMGASMTSFAAGWEKDDAGVWHYYDSDDDMVTGEWRKDGAKWFYLDEDGDMLLDSWVDDEYYVGADGAMLVNQWAKTISEDAVDDPDEDGDHWFYFGSKGKKVTNDKKKINGKTYFFNEDGEMRDGWYDSGNGIYYLGGEDEGGRAENQWLWLECPDEDDDTDDGDWDHSNCTTCDDEGWYWFGSDGKMFQDASKKKRVNGKDYYFNAHGQMLYEWINTKANNQLDGIAREETDEERASKSEANYYGGDAASQAQAEQKENSQTVDAMRYANQVEDGSRTNGWYEIEGSEDAYSDGDTNWYYFDDGEAQKADITKPRDQVMAHGIAAKDDDKNVYRARIKCEGKYFCFNEVGQMQTGLQMVQGAIYYFDGNGYMKTGKVADIEEEDNDLYNYYFTTKSGGNGKGINGEKDGYLYWNGKRLEADDDYRFYYVNGDLYLVNNKGKLQKSSKKYDLEAWDAENVYVEISKSSYVVTGIAVDKDGYLSDSKGDLKKLSWNGKDKDDKADGSLSIYGMMVEDHISIPYISIYDNVLSSAYVGIDKDGDTVFVSDYTGKFFDETDDVWAELFPGRK